MYFVILSEKNNKPLNILKDRTLVVLQISKESGMYSRIFTSKCGQFWCIMDIPHIYQTNKWQTLMLDA